MAPIPRDQNEADRLRKTVEESPIPEDPGLTYDASKEARSMSEYYRSVQTGIPESAQRIEENKKRFHDAVGSIRNLTKDPKSCLTKETQGMIGSGLKSLYTYMSFADPYSYDPNGFSKTQAEIERLYRTPSDAELCKQLAPSMGSVLPLDTVYDAETGAMLKSLSDRKAFVISLQNAWEARMTKLNQSLTQQKQAFDILRALPWIVVLLCLFSMAVLFAIRFFGADIQMELVTSGQVIQFPTVMALLVVVVALGLPGILKENTLAALLGGIGGYVLSQGVGRAAAREGERRARMGVAEGNTSINSLVVAPASSTVPVGGKQAFTVIGTSSDGAVRDLSSVVDWAISDENIARIGDKSENQFAVSGYARGKTLITARLNGIRGQAELIVT